MEEEGVKDTAVDKAEDVLAIWKKAQPLPPDAETLEMGKIKMKSLGESEMLFWKIKRIGREECAIILAVHSPSPERITPIAMNQFKDEIALHLFVNELKRVAMQEWMNPWWKGSEQE